VVKILDKELQEGEERDEIFGVKLYDPTNGVKISKRDVCHVELVKDAKSARQAQALQSLLKKIENEENTSWGQQIKNAIMLHPTKEENGEINDVTCFDAVLHFLSIGWKVIFAIACPPPHKGGGYPCLVAGITCIGFVTYIVAEVAGLFGCVLGVLPGVTAITFVAIGTSLPDTFASMTAARNSRHADEAVGNITGSNCVNVFLGLGLPWMIATIWKLTSDECSLCTADETNNFCVKECAYEVPANGLILSVILFLSCSAVGFLILIMRRVFLKGELGGSSSIRYASCFAFICLWVIYIIFASLGTYGVIDLDAYIMGEKTTTIAGAAKSLFEQARETITKG